MIQMYTTAIKKENTGDSEEKNDRKKQILPTRKTKSSTTITLEMLGWNNFTLKKRQYPDFSQIRWSDEFESNEVPKTC